MGRETGIAWTRSSFNPWIGCTKVSPGCDACYAEALDARHRWGGKTHWGVGVQRKRTTEAYWKDPLRWNEKAGMEKVERRVLDKTDWTIPGFWPVFPSLCDPFDKEVPEKWRRDFFDLINATPNLTWLLLTKRIVNVGKMMPPFVYSAGPWSNVWIGASVVNQEEADRDLPKLVALTGFKRRFVSYEPALGPIDFRTWLEIDRRNGGSKWIQSGFRSAIDQIIVGGESAQGGKEPRGFCLDWATFVRDQCEAAGVSFFMKQFGSDPFFLDAPGPADGQNDGMIKRPIVFKSRAGTNPAEWPSHLRIQEFPR